MMLAIAGCVLVSGFLEAGGNIIWSAAGLAVGVLSAFCCAEGFNKDKGCLGNCSACDIVYSFCNCCLFSTAFLQNNAFAIVKSYKGL